MSLTAHLTFTDILFFSLAVIGMTHIIVDSVFFLSIREWIAGKADEGSADQPKKPWWLFKFANKVVQCYQCCGTWSGFLLGFALLSWNPVVIFAAGCAGSFLSYTAAVLLTYLEANSVTQPKG